MQLTQFNNSTKAPSNTGYCTPDIGPHIVCPPSFQENSLDADCDFPINYLLTIPKVFFKVQA